MSPIISLRPYQERDLARIRDTMRAGARRVLYVAPTGSGKTILFGWLARSATAKGKRCLVLVHRRELLRQTREKLALLGAADVPVETVQAASRRGAPDCDLLVCDECFVPGTIVSGKPIEKINPGDYVECFDPATLLAHETRVMRRYVKKTTRLWRITLDSGNNVVCTGNHLFYGPGGWSNAASLEIGVEVYATPMLDMSNHVPRQKPHAGIELEEGQECCLLGHMPASTFFVDDGSNQQETCLSKDDCKKPDAQSGCQEKSVGYVAGDETSPAYSRRQRSSDASSSGDAVGRSWSRMGSGTRRFDATHNWDEKNKASIQNRSGEPDSQGRDRSRWNQPSFVEDKRERSSKNRSITIARVAGVEIFEQGRDGEFERLCPGGVVYDLEVEKFHTYFANNFAVHNCHHLVVGGSWHRVLDGFRGHALGVTATPERLDGKGLRGSFEEMVIGPSVRELVDAGWLADYRAFSSPAQSRKGLKRVGGDFARGAAAAWVSGQRRIVGDMVDGWREQIKGPAVAFCATVEHARDVAAEMCARGVRAASIDGGMGDPERATLVDALGSGSLDVLTSCDLISEGFDCLDQQTEILTPGGWRGIGKVAVGDAVATFNSDTREIEYKPVYRYIERLLRPSENMYHLKSQHMDIRVTGGHNIYYRTIQPKKSDRMSPDVRVETIARLVERAQPFAIPISAPFVDGFPGVSLSDQELRFIAWFITDGHLDKKRRYLSITQSTAKSEYVEKIRTILSDLSLDFLERVRTPLSGFPNGKPAHEFRIPKGTGRGSLKRNGWGKYAPYIVKDKAISPLLHAMDRRQFAVFWEALLDGDGTRQTGKSGTLTVPSIEQANAYMHMAVVRGYAAMYGIYKTKSGKPIYNLRVRDKQWHTIALADHRSAKIVISANPNESVWCVSVDNHTLVTRRKGKIAILGNCPALQGVIMLRPTASLAMHLQMCGRALRPKGDGSAAMIMDHVGNCAEHGLPDEYRLWSLDGRKAREVAEAAAKGGGGRRKAPETVEGQLERVDPVILARWRSDKRAAVRGARSVKELNLICAALGWKRGAAWHEARRRGWL